LKRLARLAPFALGAGLAFASVARAEGPPPPSPAKLPERAAQVALEKGVVHLTLGFRDVIDAEIAGKLSSGLPTVVTMRGYLFRESGGDPVALTAKSCRIVYDLWDEVFRIQLVQPGGSTQVVAVNVEGVRRFCCEARKLPLVDRALLATGARYFVATLVEVNPVSQEMLDRIKRWVSRPGGNNGIGPGDSLFGSFVGLFVARIGDADRKLAFRTPAFVTPEPPPP
jgi:hypothetical protein